MTADTTQPAGALPEPAYLDQFSGASAYSPDQVRAMMAERDAARRDADLAWQTKAVAMEVAAAEIATLRQKLDTARDALEHYQHGGSEYRKIAARALEAIGSQIPPDAREGREPLTINQIREGYEGRPVIERAAFIAGVFHAEKLHGIGPVGTSAESVTVKGACAKVCGTFPSFGGTSADGETQP